MFYVAGAPVMDLSVCYADSVALGMRKYGISTVHMYIFVCAPEGILLLFVCLDLLFFVFFVVPVWPTSEDGRVAESCRLVF